MKDRHEFYDRDGGHWVIENQHFAVWRDTKTGETHHTIYEPILCEEISSLAAEVERLRAEREWRPVSETPECPRWAIVKLVRSDGWVSYELIDAFVSWSDFDETVAGGSLAWEAVGWRYLLPEPPDEVCG